MAYSDRVLKGLGEFQTGFGTFWHCWFLLFSGFSFVLRDRIVLEAGLLGVRIQVSAFAKCLDGLGLLYEFFFAFAHVEVRSRRSDRGVHRVCEGSVVNAYRKLWRCIFLHRDREGTIAIM